MRLINATSFPPSYLTVPPLVLSGRSAMHQGTHTCTGKDKNTTSMWIQPLETFHDYLEHFAGKQENEGKTETENLHL